MSELSLILEGNVKKTWSKETIKESIMVFSLFCLVGFISGGFPFVGPISTAAFIAYAFAEHVSIFSKKGVEFAGLVFLPFILGSSVSTGLFWFWFSENEVLLTFFTGLSVAGVFWGVFALRKHLLTDSVLRATRRAP